MTDQSPVPPGYHDALAFPLFDGLNTNSLLGASGDPAVPGLGFHFAHDPRWPGPNPTGRPGRFEGHCPPHFPAMADALQAVIARKYGPGGPYNPETEGPWLQPGRVRGAAEMIPAGIVDCTAHIAQYILDSFGKFPGTVPTIFVRTFLQAHHLDLAFYDTHFAAGAYLDSHANHMSQWHPDE